MDETEIMNVRVVETESNYTETIKNAAIAGVVTVLATSATTWMLGRLNDRMQLRRVQKANAQKLDESNEPEA